MVQRHASTPTERAQVVSTLIAQAGQYGLVTDLSRRLDVSRQTLSVWKATGVAALEQAFTPVVVPAVVTPMLERTVLTLLVEGHASIRGIERCLEIVGQPAVSLGTITAIIGEAQARALAWGAQHAVPTSARALALDELYGNQRQAAYLSVVDVASYAVWYAAGPVAADSESWTLVLWDVQAQGVRWHTTVSDGGGAIQEAGRTVDPSGQQARDVWHVLHRWGQGQGRLQRRVTQLGAQTPTVERQAARVVAGQRPLGRKPVSDLTAQAAAVATATRLAEGVRYLGCELRRLLEVVVLDRRGVLNRAAREADLAALLALLAELAAGAPPAAQREIEQLHAHLAHALPQLLAFTGNLDRLQLDLAQVLGADGVALVAWAWQRRRILGPTAAELLAQLPGPWRPAAAVLLTAWDEAVRASSAVENWHSILRPHLAVHRTLSPGLLALLVVWHNHRVFTRGKHAGQNPLELSGLPDAPTDWLVALGYPPVERSRQTTSRTTPSRSLKLVA